MYAMTMQTKTKIQGGGVASGMMGNPVEVKTGMNREEAEKLAEKMEQELTDRVNKIFGLNKAASPAKNTAA